jgi:iron complex outermembrane recepter protein
MTNYTLRSAVHRALVTATFATLAGTGTTALAQQAPGAQAQAGEGLGEIVVTGSRIAVPNLESISPVTAVSAADIQASGKTNIADLLNQLPQVFASQGATLSNGSSGIAEVNLRNLGAQRTLVLVNGRRLGPGDATTGGASSDVNQIPTDLVERVEVLTGGASATYGADAAAGVVNFIMNTHFEGVKVTVNYDFYNHHQHDGAAAAAVTEHDFALPPGTVNTGQGKDATVTMGMNTPDGKGNAVVYVSYRNNLPTVQSSYDYSSCTLGSGASFAAAGCGGSSTAAPGRFNTFTGFNSPGFSNLALGPSVTPGAGGVLQPFTNADRFNYGPLNYFLRPDERWSIGSFDHYELNSHADVYAEVMVMRDDSTSQIAPSGAFFGNFPNDPYGLGGLEVNCSNPFLSASEVAAWCNSGPATSANIMVPGPNGTTVPGTLLYIGRRNVEGGDRQQELIHESFRTVVGVRGEMGGGWNYDVYAQNAIVDSSNTYLNDVSWTNIQNSLLVTGTAANPSCVSGGACVPWNIFGTGPVSAGATNYIAVPLLEKGTTDEKILHADITGDLGKFGWQLPSAHNGLKLNAGLEWREEQFTFLPDYSYQQDLGAGQGGATLPLNGSLNVHEAFAEAHLPIIEDHPGAKTVSADLGYRYSSYSLGFNTNTYKAGVQWAPTSDFNLRTSFNRAVRAPDVSELYSPQQVVLDGSLDPCAGATPTFTAAQCAFEGVKPGQYGNIAANPASQYNGLTGGSPKNQPETAKTFSYGIAFTPSAIPDLHVEADFFNIDIVNVLDSPGADLTKLICGESGDPTTCGLIHRSAIGTLWTGGGFVTDLTTNLGELQTKGFDIQAGYRVDMRGAGRLDLRFIGTLTQDFIFSPEPGASYDCVGLYGLVCGAPQPKWRHTLTGTWETPVQGLSATLQWRYLGSVSEDASSSNPILQFLSGGLNPTDAHHPSINYLDVSAAWRVAEKYTFRVGINNLLDKDPPINGTSSCPVGQCNGNTFPQVYDALGRYVFAQITAQF